MTVTQTEPSDSAPPSSEGAELARLVREEIARRRISRQALADMARISLSTLEKALAGKRAFTLATLLRIEEALGVNLRAGTHAPAAAPHARDVAPDTMGAYARSAVTWLEGRYLTIRPSFGTPGGLFAYLTTVRWVPEKACLGFAESGRSDSRFEQAGHVSLPNLSGHIYLVTNEQGQYRLAILSRPTIEGQLFGILTTLEVGSGSQLVPAAAPIALRKLADGEDAALGPVTAEMPHFAAYRDLLGRSTEGDFARLHLPC
ncbi:helix-turn-helix domain-containing protein [Novosphingobium lindaniclasticum]|uniref:XRE family transcriptional regulator n=1 Tax=Novosphingobium lindaniclasticum LE124 TaxID=1096930 RepID=T0HSY8_9SPHN|nr:helix-turn-helix domain-containing protein [Novosphingobium lindaniclasticum]EQB15228.1 XRE family transcriptional regulator [Novosphingobium lindaniclasticum LE124]